jgi:hypothetical protein
MNFQGNDRQQLEAAKEKNFIDSCITEFIEVSVNDGNRKKIKHLLSWSYLPNLLSITTAGFFIIYLLQDYSILIRVFLVTLLLVVAGSIEYGKRALISETGKTYFLTNKIPAGIFAGAVVLIIVSMTISFIGGQKLITTTAKAPDKITNPKIDSLNNLLAIELDLIESLKKTTWANKVTRDAVKGHKCQQSNTKQYSDTNRPN